MSFVNLQNFIRLVVSLLLLISTTISLADDDRWRFTTTGKIFSIGDIHGDYNAFVAIMQEAGLIDSDNNWTGGITHFVSTGDYTDRGPDSRKVMDLFMKLEKQAVAAGGKFHVLLGNHEVMNLIGDRRYIAIAEYAAFAADEDKQERSKYLQQFLKHSKSSNLTEAETKFNQLYPPGYFGLHAGFKQNGYYGRWLKDKPFMIIINDRIFTHGGLSAAVAEQGLTGINTKLNSEMNSYASLWYQLIEDGLFFHHILRRDRVTIAKALVENGITEDSAFNNKPDQTMIDRIHQFLNVADTILFGSNSPTWYRGTALCHQFSELPLVDNVFKNLDADSAYLGHTITHSREVESRFDGKVFLQDTGMLNKVYRGQASLVVHSGDNIQVFDSRHGLHDIKQQPSRVWYRPYKMTDQEIEDFLLTAEVIAEQEIHTGITSPLKLTLKKDGRTIHALYKNIDSDPGLEKPGRWPKKGNYADRYLYELAAYELNKLLALDLVPPTVKRAYQGQKGIFQYWIKNSINRTEMLDNGIVHDGYCSEQSQHNLMKVFDALIHNDDRNFGNILYQQDDWQIWLIDHSRAFAVSNSLSKKMKKSKLKLSSNFRQQLAAMNKKDVKKALSKYLHHKQITSILRRRDIILSKF